MKIIFNNLFLSKIIHLISFHRLITFSILVIDSVSIPITLLQEYLTIYETNKEIHICNKIMTRPHHESLSNYFIRFKIKLNSPLVQ